MVKSISIQDNDYKKWIKELSVRYRNSQIKAAVMVNNEMLHFYWLLGRDIVEMKIEERWGEKVISNLSVDLQRENPNLTGFSRRNIYYCKQFYQLYKHIILFMPQVEAQFDWNISGSNETQNVPQVAEHLLEQLCSVPWGHHKLIIDKFSDDVDKALFYVNQTIENGWSRAVLLNIIDTQLYERQSSGTICAGIQHSTNSNI